jgi:transposase InsO family protein
LTISVRNSERLSLEQIREFLNASEEVEFESKNRQEVYNWMSRTLREHGYDRQKRPVKGLLLAFLQKMTGYSRSQVTRLVKRWAEQRELRKTVYRRRRFPKRYTTADIALLASVDEAHETLSGPATKRILEREYRDFDQAAYERLAEISVSHIYNLRRTHTYRQKRVRYQKTRPTAISIGERRRPCPDGKPGYLRVDTVHQGDLDGVKGVYHINAVDEVTQWQVIGATWQISEAGLIPVLKDMLRQFPFALRGFHSDNGSEFINGSVEKLLKKLLVEQTKSRPRRSNDNGLVESKNGAVIRKHIGYGHIATEHAASIHEFYEEYLNPYLNFHRPCGQAEVVSDVKGRQKRVYRRYETPWEVLRKIPDVGDYLKPGQRLEGLAELAAAESDTACARRMQAAKDKLFRRIHRRESRD